MPNKGTSRIQRGQALTFRIPSDTPDHIIKQLQNLKETEKRNFSSKIAEYALEGVGKSLAKERETITIPLPKPLNKEQRNWLKHSHSEALLGSIVYQLLVDPVRATSILASLNSTAPDIDDALYLQEEEDIFNTDEHSISAIHMNSFLESSEETKTTPDDLRDQNKEDDLLNFDLEKAREELASSREDTNDVKEEDPDDLLGDFLALMNK
ncbi:hypothetical protein GCM10008967_27120 [Bacillus carboniphilus]|uniref:Plasmid segregation centromere-binding protein ParR n=1 Tax=Bacillus carboniphilus TaxID=86663 RepID=A0ABN0WER5_9BACI